MTIVTGHERRCPGAPLARERLRAGPGRAGLAAGLLIVVACGPSTVPPLRLWSNDLAFEVSADPVPPPARQDVVFKVVVRDKTTRQAIEGGEGRIYATSADRVNAWDALTDTTPATKAPGPPGTYYGKLNFLTAGDWSMGLQFRRDSTQPIETLDWKQTVYAARDEPPIQEPTK
jgi:hypothetical protein